MEKTLVNITDWMNMNRLKMNDSKTEFIMIGSRQQMKKVTFNSLKVNDKQVEAADSIKYLGIHLDTNLNLKKHVTAKCKIACMNLYRISIRKNLTQDACTSLGSSRSPRLCKWTTSGTAES